MARSAEAHRPLRRVRRAGGAMRLLLLIGGAVVMAGSDTVGGLVDGSRWIGAMVGAGAVVAAIRLPEPIVRWLVARLPGVEPVDLGSPAARWGRELAAVVAPLALLAVIAGWVLAPLTDPDRGWMIAGVAGVAVVLTGALATANQARRAGEIDVPAAWSELAERAGLGGRAGFGPLDVSGGSTGGDGPGWEANACAVGLGPWRRVLVGGGVEPGRSATAFVVAHELVHLARRHPELQLLANGIGVFVAIGVVPVLAATGQLTTLVDPTPADPTALPAIIVIVVVSASLVRLPLAWLARGLERVADAGAIDLIGVPGKAEAQRLHLGSGVELDPPLLVRLLTSHPPPAERLAYLERCRSVSSSASSGSG